MVDEVRDAITEVHDAIERGASGGGRHACASLINGYRRWKAVSAQAIAVHEAIGQVAGHPGGAVDTPRPHGPDLCERPIACIQNHAAEAGGLLAR